VDAAARDPFIPHGERFRADRSAEEQAREQPVVDAERDSPRTPR